MKDIVQCAEKVDEKQGEIQIDSSERNTKEEERKKGSDLKQPSIFDF
jgi:hypothetical protein